MADGAIVHEAESDEISSRFLLVMALVAALGFSSHRLRPMVRSRGMAWAELISYAIGGVMVIAVFPMIYSMALAGANADGASRKQNVFVAFLSLVLSFGAIGAGVAAGWIVDPDEAVEEV